MHAIIHNYTATEVAKAQAKMAKRWAEIEARFIEPILDEALEIARPN